MKKIIPLSHVTLIATSVILSGCATVRQHAPSPKYAHTHMDYTGDPTPQYVYAGTQANVQHMAFLFSGETTGDQLGDSIAKSMFLWHLIDFPFSIVADTIIVPYDVYKVTLGGNPHMTMKAPWNFWRMVNSFLI